MSDFYEMSARMRELFPSNPEADKKALMQMAGGSAPIETPAVIQENVQVQEGSLQMDKEYSMSDFARLAGITLNETQKDRYLLVNLKAKINLLKVANLVVTNHRIRLEIN